MHQQISEDVIRTVCNEEQIAYLESSRADNPRLEGAARALRHKCKITQKQVGFSHLLEIAKLLNIDVWTAEATYFPENVDGVVFGFTDKDDTYKCYIIVKEGLTARAARFCIAHEIGHVVLNHAPVLVTEAMSSFSSYRHYLQNEFEANHIAGALLMDEYLFKQDLQKEKNDLQKLCDYYEVSYETAAYRFAIVSDMNIHFIKIDSDGNVLKRLARSTDNVNWIAMKKFCKCTAARKVFDQRESTKAQVSVISDGDGNTSIKLFCFSKQVPKRVGGKRVSITIGCRYEDAENFASYHELKEQGYEVHEVSSYSCGSGCVVKHCEHNRSF